MRLPSRLPRFLTPLPRLAALLVFAAALAPAAARANTITVTAFNDTLNNADGLCSVREAVVNANNDAATWANCAAGSGADTINLPAGTITFTIGNTPHPFTEEQAAVMGDLDIAGPVTVNGHASGTTIDAADLDRIFDINTDPDPNDANFPVPITVFINRLTMTNGRINSDGGGVRIFPDATVTIDRSTVSNNVITVNDGGGIYLIGGTLHLTNSTVSGNQTGLLYGGIGGSGVINLTNCTVTNNRTTDGTPTRGQGAGGGQFTIRNTIIAGNGPATSPDVEGAFTSLGYNIVGRTTDSFGNPTAIITPAAGDQIGVGGVTVNLGPLQNNGGPTPTHALGAGSIATDQGHSSGASVDQRGETRPCDLASVANAAGGDGGDVGAFEVQGACAGSNQPPSAADDTAATSEETPVTVSVLANDADPDGDGLTISAVTQGANGSVVNNGDGTVTYSPAPNFFGADSFTYTASDGQGGFDTATVSVNVSNVNDAPSAADDSAAVAEDGGPVAVGVLANDSDPDGNPLAVVAATQGTNGSVTFNSASASYTPNPNFSGPDSFTYTVSDGAGGFDTATVHVNVTPANDAPAAQDDGYGMNQDTTLTVGAPGVLANDSDVDGDALAAALVTPPAQQDVFAFNPDGSFTYKPPAGFTGLVSFTYKAQDGAADSNVATVNITVADTQGPALVSTVTATSLWPPNHNLVNVGLAVSAADNSGDPVQISVAVYSDEDDLTPGSPEHSPDAKDIAPGTLRLRAERDGAGDGRVYLIIITATDSSSNTSRNCLTVVVPKSKSAADAAAAAQQAQAALAHCAAHGTPPAGFFLVGDGPVVGPKQ
jgi:Bacterial Ig domain